MSGETVGIVLRPGAVEAVRVTGGFGGTRVAGTARVSILGGEPAHVAQAIKWAVERTGAKTGRIAVAVPSHDVLLRSFTLPPVPRGEWESAVQFEAHKFIPFKTTELVWDYVAAQKGANKPIDVVFAAIERATFLQL